MNPLERFKLTAEQEQLFWGRLADDNVLDGSSGEAIEPDRHYLAVRLRQTHLQTSRKLWRRYRPLLHSWCRHLDGEQHGVVDPRRFSELGSTGLDRIVNVNQRIAGPIPYRGGDVAVVVGLWSIPGDDTAGALLGTLSGITSIASLAAGLPDPVALAGVVKDGLDGLLSLGSSQLRLGVCDTFSETRLHTGVHVGIGAPRSDVEVARLWIDASGTLLRGQNPIAGRPYAGHDYIVLQVERLTERADWRGMPRLARYQDVFEQIMDNRELDVGGKHRRLADEWPGFRNALAQTEQLVGPDRERIAGLVADDLTGRLDAERAGSPFESRGIGEPVAPHGFDLLDVPEAFDPTDSGAAERARLALSGNPFA